MDGDKVSTEAQQCDSAESDALHPEGDGTRHFVVCVCDLRTRRGRVPAWWKQGLRAAVVPHVHVDSTET